MRKIARLGSALVLAVSTAVTLAGAASANSITLEFSTGGTDVTLSAATAASNALSVDVYANFSAVGGGQRIVWTSVRASAGLTPVACKETQSQTIGAGPTNATWGRYTGNCGAGFPGDGGIHGQVVRGIEQEMGNGWPAGSSSGTIKVGTVTFHVVGATGLSFINATYIFALDGFVGVDDVTRAPTFLGGVTVRFIPEPATVTLLASGLLGILGFRRRARRR